jgi:peptidoglycan/LPS O-acetylase OafA/YrhL
MASATRAASEGQSERLYYVDAIRILAIGLVLLAHVVEVFNPWDEWHIANLERSRVAGEVAVLVAPWVMPIVMLLAGVSAWYSLRRRDNTTYVRERAVRLLVPLAAGTLILVPPQVYLERRLHGQFAGSFFAFYPHFFQGVYPDGNLSWHHLWFLAHLFAYSVLALPLFRYLQRGDNRAMHWAARVCGGPGGILWLAVPLILERNVLWGLFRERHMLTSDWSNHALLFVAYIYGFILAGTPWLGSVIDAQWRRTMLLGAIGTGVLGIGAWNGMLPSRIPPPYSLKYLAFWTLYAVCAWAWMVGVLGAGRRWVRHDSPLLRYGRRVGYGLYIVHQPIIVAVAFVVVQWHQPVAVKFLVVLVTSIIGTVLSAEVVGRVPFARALLGLSTRPAPIGDAESRPEERSAEGPPAPPRWAQ